MPVSIVVLLTLIALFCGLPPAAHAAVDGATLYARNCAACHGERGEGGIGVPLALPSFQAGVSNEYLRKTIRYGRPGRVMPAFDRLKPAEVNALVNYIRHGYRGPVPHFSMAPIRGNAVHGAKLYAQYCAACHGARGEGGQGTGVTFSRPRSLPLMPPALNNQGFLRAASDAMIRETLRHGRSGTPMVSFLDKGLSETDIDDIVSFVRAFEQDPILFHGASAVGEAPVIVRNSPYDLQTTVEKLKRAIVSNNFIFGRMQTLDYGFVPPAQSNGRQVILYFCNVAMLNQGLGIDPRIGMFLPCRVTVVEQGGKVRLMSINPRVLSGLFNNSELTQLCERMHESYVKIMEEASI